MTKYKAKIEYTAATMDAPFCIIEGFRYVTAENKEDAVEEIKLDACRYGYENFKVVSIEEV